jgi:hypothetical protein
VGRFGTGRQVVLYAHLSADAIRSHAPDAVVNVENAGGQLLTTDQVAEWCGRADTAQVVVNPVIDLNTTASVDGYRVRESIAEKVRLRDRTCVFPSCHRPARGCDLDHIDPYVPTDEGGPPGQTSTENLACLCRLHHRMKTHAGWTYSMLVPGAFVWHSPHGHTWLRDPGGTTDLTTDPVGTTRAIAPPPRTPPVPTARPPDGGGFGMPSRDSYRLRGDLTVHAPRTRPSPKPFDVPLLTADIRLANSTSPRWHIEVLR